MMHPDIALRVLTIEQERVDAENEHRRVHAEREAERADPAVRSARRRMRTGLVLRLGRAQ